MKQAIRVLNTIQDKDSQIMELTDKLHRRNIQLADFKNKLIKAYERIEKLQERINL